MTSQSTINKTYITWDDAVWAAHYVANSLKANGFKPDLIVALVRGGAIPATIISYRMNVPVMYFDPKSQKTSEVGLDLRLQKLLIVDDINDTGNTLENVRSQLLKGDPNEITEGVDKRNNVKFVTLINNKASSFTVDHFGHEIDKSVDDSWIVFPWESFR